MTAETWMKMATAAIHAGEIRDSSGSHVAPIYQTSTFTFSDMDAVEAYAAGESDAYIYSRGGNPARTALATKLAALEGYGVEGSPVSAEIFGSGMAAISATLMGLAKAGDHIVAQQVLYGTADHLITDVLPEYGVTNSRISLLDLDRLEQELTLCPTTTIVYLETPANPTMSLVDISAVSEIAHAHGAMVVADNTFATPVLQRPLELGADCVVHSTTKYINGHGTVVGGAAVSRNAEVMDERIRPLIKAMGGIPSPFDCWLTNLGLKTLPLRMGQHCANAMAVATHLEGQASVHEVRYPGLANHPQHEIANRQMDGYGAMIAFDLGSHDAAVRFLDRVELCSLAVSLGNIDTLIEHPASMTHRIVDPDARAASGITDGLIRMSVGLESADDIIADIDRALNG